MRTCLYLLSHVALFCGMTQSLQAEEINTPPVTQAETPNTVPATATEYGHLQSHEPFYIGYTVDQDDVPFMDFKLSMKYPILHNGKANAAAFGFAPYPYFTFSARFGQYLGTRESSPVLAKRYNPELSGRYWLATHNGRNSTLDVIYGHESNGQSVTDPNSYLAKKIELAVQHQDLKYADDYISRGWDYVGLLWSEPWDTTHGELFSFIKVHYFLDNGLLQGKAEEYNSWEDNREGKKRRKTDGLSFSLKRNVDLNNSWFNHSKVFLQYVTGIEEPTRFNTLRLELAFTTGNLPLMLWLSHGYNSDLADYYRELNSVGMAIELESM